MLRLIHPAITAGVLLAMASGLLFAVVSSFKPSPQISYTTPIPATPLPPEAAITIVPAPAASQPQVTQLPEPIDTSSVGKQSPSDTAVSAAANSTLQPTMDNTAIHDLWDGKVILGFGWQLHPLYQDWRYHNGIDLSGDEGQIVPALLTGEVTDIFTDRQYGQTVTVKSGKYILYYGSLASVAVHKNTTIKTGSHIGSMGVSPSEREPHLHLAVKGVDSGNYIDPDEIFPNIPK